MSDVIEVEGIGEVYAGKLRGVGIATDQDLLEHGATREGRSRIARESGIGEALILRWVNQVDLYRIKGVESQYAELLEASGVDSVPELAQRNPANLHPRLIEVNEKKRLVRKLPTERQLAGLDRPGPDLAQGRHALTGPTSPPLSDGDRPSSCPGAGPRPHATVEELWLTGRGLGPRSTAGRLQAVLTRPPIADASSRQGARPADTARNQRHHGDTSPP